MNTEYYIEKNTFCNKLLLFFRLCCLLYYFTTISYSYQYFNMNSKLLFFFMYIFFDIIYIIDLSYYIYKVYINYNKYFSNVHLYIEWKKNIGLRKYNIREISIFSQYICSLIITLLDIKHFFTFTNINLLYSSALLFIKITCILKSLFLILIIICIAPCFYCNLKRINYLNKITIPIMNILEECSICMDSSNNNNWTKTDCNHYFHIECINKWKQINNTCPNCRSNLNFSV
jgi:hypothetical protein